MFNDIFQQITAREIENNVFKLVGEDFFVVTAGTETDFNSMVGSGGGLGMLMKKPCSWIILANGRYTLEYIQKNKTYTLSFFADSDKEKMMFLGSKSGRDTDKMKECKLTAVTTPSGNISYKEAALIIECKLVQTITPDITDFTSDEVRNHLNEMYLNPDEVRKYLIGEITCVWKKR